VLVALAACSQSDVDPEADVVIEGRVLDVDGSPLDDRPVHLGVGMSPGDLGVAVLTLGLSCTGGECGDRFDTTTDGDGAYSLTLKGSDTQSFFGSAEETVLSASAAPGDGEVSGASVSATFEVQTERVRLPDLALVDPGVRVERDEVTWDPASGFDVAAFETDAAVPVWRTTGAGSAPVDGRILEDATGRVVVAGVVADEIEGSDVRIVRRSPGIGFVGPYGAPPSRGAGGELTDGDLVTDVALTAPATIALTDAVPAELVVVRGCEATCAVETSADGQTFVAAGAVTGAHGVIELPGADVRVVRVTATSLREVSVWGPAPEIEREDADESSLRDVFGIAGGDDDGSPSPWLVAIAAAAAGGMLVAVSRARRGGARAAGDRPAR